MEYYLLTTPGKAQTLPDDLYIILKSYHDPISNANDPKVVLFELYVEVEVARPVYF